MYSRRIFMAPQRAHFVTKVTAIFAATSWFRKRGREDHPDRFRGLLLRAIRSEFCFITLDGCKFAPELNGC